MVHYNDLIASLSCLIENSLTNTTNCLGISINTNRPKKVDIFYSSDPANDDPPFIGAGYVKALPYKVYSSNNKGESWTAKATLPSPPLHAHGAGGRRQLPGPLAGRHARRRTAQTGVCRCL